MALALKPKDIDHIIKLVKQLKKVYTKRDFLTKKDQKLLEQYVGYEFHSQQLKQTEAALSNIGVENEEQKDLIEKHIERCREELNKITTPYEIDKAKQLKNKLSRAKWDYRKSKIDRLIEELERYWVPRWPEIKFTAIL